MVDTDKNAVKIGFLDENVKEKMNAFLEKFDLICTENTSFDELLDYISENL